MESSSKIERGNDDRWSRQRDGGSSGEPVVRWMSRRGTARSRSPAAPRTAAAAAEDTPVVVQAQSAERYSAQVTWFFLAIIGGLAHVVT
eukprot:COSAG01_NODE_48951_length_376_cov_1.115523_1_plen_88_part_01